MRISTLLAGAGALLVLQGLFTAGMLHVERMDGFCTVCHLHMVKQHDMHRPAADMGHLTSRHFEVGVGCADCHREPGALGRVVTLYTLGLSDAINFVAGGYEEPQKLTVHLKNAMCIECHGETLARTGDIDTYHGNKNHNDRQDIRCTSCHVHHRAGDPGFAYLSLPAFESGCASCHEGLFPHARPAQRLEPATGEFSQMRRRLRAKGVIID